MPEDGGVRRQVFRQIAPITTILQLIEDTVDDLSFAPTRRSGLLLVGQQWLNDFPLFVTEATGVWHWLAYNVAS